MATLYLVRHGQTTFNLEKRLQGRQDSPLTPLGVEQVKDWLYNYLRHHLWRAIAVHKVEL